MSFTWTADWTKTTTKSSNVKKTSQIGMKTGQINTENEQVAMGMGQVVKDNDKVVKNTSPLNSLHLLTDGCCKIQTGQCNPLWNWQLSIDQAPTNMNIYMYIYTCMMRVVIHLLYISLVFPVDLLNFD